MKFGYLKVGACTPEIKVADTVFNAKSIISEIKKANEKMVEVLVFPELCITGATCGDLFYSNILLDGAKKALKEITNFSEKLNMLIFVGLPLKINGFIYDVSAVINKGKILAFIPKSNLLNYNEINDSRFFASYNNAINYFYFDEENNNIPIGNNIIFIEQDNKQIKIAVEISQDIFAVNCPSTRHAINGANIIVNLSAINLIIERDKYIENIIKTQSGKLCAGYVFANAGNGESTTDLLYAGGNLIAENGKIINKTEQFNNGLICSEIDVEFLNNERSKCFNNVIVENNYHFVEFSANNNSDNIERIYSKFPFIPSIEKSIFDRAKLILSMQSKGLEKRIKHTNVNKIVIGLSGGLDSTLAILVVYKAMQNLGRNVKDIIAVTMPCFGTTSRTFDNTVKLAKALGVTLKKIDIAKSVTRHLKDIKHQIDLLDTTYENAQARERTQVLMDIANMNNGLVIGTGDLSELALGWATYNGDHMSMYSVNCSIPKTLVRHIVNYYANESRGKLRSTLLDILETPVSPELLPPSDGDISQKTEDIVGPYILHDFFLYYFVRCGFSSKKIFFIACKTFEKDFSKQTILKWLKNFVKRFFSQQFKRSCMPDGIKIGTVGFSPRGDWKMPSDAVCSLWLDDLEIL